MTNEELAVKAKAHEDLAVLELWEAVRRFVEMKAAQYLRAADYNTIAEYDDLAQDGFIAMLDAVELFDPERGTKFTTILTYTIKKRFAEEGGHRSQKQQRSRSIQFAESLDAPVQTEVGEFGSYKEVIIDPCGEYAFALVEYYDYRRYVRRLLYAALQSLTDTQRERIIRYYFHNVTMEEMGGSLESRQTIQQSINRGLRYLRRGKYRRELWAALQGFEDFRELQSERQRSAELHAIAKNKAGG